MTDFKDFTKEDVKVKDEETGEETLMSFKDFQKTERHDVLYNALRRDFPNIPESTLIIMFNYWYSKHILEEELTVDDLNGLNEVPEAVKGEMKTINVYEDQAEYYTQNPHMKEAEDKHNITMI